jgi:hypothetical protein
MSRWIDRGFNVVGFVLLAWYLASTGDWRFSLVWAGVFVALAYAVSFALVLLKVPERFPRLNRRLVAPSGPRPKDEAEWINAQATYLQGFERNVALSPAEDGLVCVPVLLAGLNPITAILGGLIFGALHLRSYTYLECWGKAGYYGIACAVVLPHGILTVVVGHLTSNVLGFMILRIAIKRHAQSPVAL